MDQNSSDGIPKILTISRIKICNIQHYVRNRSSSMWSTAAESKFSSRNFSYPMKISLNVSIPRVNIEEIFRTLSISISHFLKKSKNTKIQIKIAKFQKLKIVSFSKSKVIDPALTAGLRMIGFCHVFPGFALCEKRVALCIELNMSTKLNSKQIEKDSTRYHPRTMYKQQKQDSKLCKKRVIQNQQNRIW